MTALIGMGQRWDRPSKILLPLVFFFSTDYSLLIMINWLKNISPTEFVIILVIILLLFGGRIAKMFGKTSGETVRELKKIKKNITDTVEGDSDKS